MKETGGYGGKSKKRKIWRREMRKQISGEEIGDERRLKGRDVSK